MATTENYITSSPRMIDPGPDKILGPGHDYDTVTERIAGIVYLPLKNLPRSGWSARSSLSVL